MTKKITNEQLAVMVQRGFKDIDKRFELFDKRFELIERRIAHIEAEIQHINARLDHMDARLNTIEHDIAEIRKHLVYRDEFEDALARIAVLEKKLGVRSGK